MSNVPSQWDEYAERARKQLPSAPEPLLDGYVQWAPWVAIVFGVLGVAASVIGGMLSLASPIFALTLVTSALEVLGGYWMLSRRLSGWWVLALGLVVGIVSDLVSVSIIALIISIAVAWVHLQVKPRYH